jgi:ribosomal protein S19
MNTIKKIYNKSQIIGPNDCDRDFLIYQGQTFVKVSITKEQLVLGLEN